jgi:molybdopterin-containing oxidoreductase family membrane subunit
MAKDTRNLPYGVGRFTPGWIIAILVLLALFAFGAYGYYQQYTQGEYVTGLRNIGSMGGVTWGLYVAIYIYLMGLSFAGITFTALVHLLEVEVLKPVARMAGAITVFSIVSGAAFIIVDIGQPLRGLVNLWKYARPQSPFFGTFSLVITGYLFASVVYMYLDGRKDAAALAEEDTRYAGFYRFWAAGYKGTDAELERREKSRFWLSVAIVPLLVTATSTLGFIFGLQAGRPGWFGALQAPGFVILASLSGVGMLIVVAAILRKALRLEDQVKEETFKALGNVLMVFNIIYVYFTVVEWISSSYSAHQQEVRISQALVSGEYSLLFWTTITFLLIPMVILVGQFVFRKFSRCHLKHTECCYLTELDPIAQPGLSMRLFWD